MDDKSFRKLARAVVIRAALDYVMLRFPGTTRRELLLWFRSEYARPKVPPRGAKRPRGACAPIPQTTRDRGAKLAIEVWQRQQVAAIGRFFEDGGSDLARIGGCYDVIDKARGPIDHNRIWMVFNRRKCWKKTRWIFRKTGV